MRPATPLRDILIDMSPARSPSFDPNKVVFRTRLQVSTRDVTSRKEKCDRQEILRTSGFACDAKEAYRPLGDPVLDSTQLILSAVGISSLVNGNTARSSSELTSKIANLTDRVHQQLKSRNAARAKNGYGLIKSEIVKSHKRLHSVRFGVPFQQVLESEKDPKDANEYVRPHTLTPSKIDWTHLRLDAEKMCHFQGLIAKQHDKEMNETLTADKPTKSAIVPRNSKIAFASRPSSPAKEGIGKAPSLQPQTHDVRLPSPTPSRPETSQSVSSSMSANTSRKLRNIKNLEENLGIKKVVATVETMGQFFTTRDNIYNHRNILNTILAEDLSRLHTLRPHEFTRKFLSLKIHDTYSANSNEIKSMRSQSANIRRKEVRDRVVSHPWFAELKHKIVFQAGTRMVITEFEELLLSRILCYIEDATPFSKHNLTQLFKTIPTEEFMKDQIQRIIRFIKLYEGVDEREYLESVEIAGHSKKTTI